MEVLIGMKSQDFHTPSSRLPNPHILCQTSLMRNLTATLCLTLAVLLGSAGMSVSQDFQMGLDAAERGDYAIALREWTPLAERGVPGAQYNLGRMYVNGWGVPQDYKTAVKWYRLAAEQGDAGAQYNLGTMYGAVLLDYVYAHMWWNIAALQGHEGATEYRDTIAERMTPSQIERAQDRARECVAKNYKGC